MVMTTLPGAEIAQQVARILVEEHYAACVQILPGMTSVYIWQDNLCTESEHLLLIKTLATKFEALEIRLKSLHPYDVPEIIALDAIAVSDSYLEWLHSSVNEGEK